MLTYGLDDIAGPPVMEEEDPLADTPERRGAKFPASSQALRHALGESIAHVMYEQVREEIDWPVLQHRADQGRCRLHCRRMTQRAADRAEKLPTPHRAGTGIWIRLRSIGKAHQ